VAHWGNLNCPSRPSKLISRPGLRWRIPVSGSLAQGQMRPFVACMQCCFTTQLRCLGRQGYGCEWAAQPRLGPPLLDLPTPDLVERDKSASTLACAEDAAADARCAQVLLWSLLACPLRAIAFPKQ